MAKQTFTTGQVLTAAQMNSLQSNDFNQTVSVKTASYTLVAADKGTRIEFNTSGSVTCTVNTGLFDAGDTLIIQNRGAGSVTITAGTATVNTSATLVLSQYDAGTLYFISASAAIFFNSDAGGGSPLTTKGDIYVYGTSDDRLPIGTNNYVLTADSTQSLGMKWAAAGTAFSGWSLKSSGLVAGTFSTNNATAKQITFDDENFDTDGFHSTSTNTSRVTIPSGKGGYYLMNIGLEWDANATGQRQVKLYKNGVAFLQGVMLANATVGVQSRLSVIVAGAVGDYFEIYGYQESGGTLNCYATAAVSAFNGCYLGA